MKVLKILFPETLTDSLSSNDSLTMPQSSTLKSPYNALSLKTKHGDFLTFILYISQQIVLK